MSKANTPPEVARSSPMCTSRGLKGETNPSVLASLDDRLHSKGFAANVEGGIARRETAKPEPCTLGPRGALDFRCGLEARVRV